MSKKEEKICNKKKKTFQRWYWLEKRRKKRKRRNHNSVVIYHGSVVQSTPPPSPLSWSSTSLKCHLISRHQFNKSCIESKWKWSSSHSTTILLDNNKQILFHPRISSSTQVILADRPLPSNGKHYWEIFMPAVYGTSIMFGIASKLIEVLENSY
jgi:hypothetical protein